MQTTSEPYESDALAAVFSECRAKLMARVRARIPAKMRGTVSEEDILQDAWIQVTRSVRAGSDAEREDAEAMLTTIAFRTLQRAIRSSGAHKHGGGISTDSLGKADAGLASAAEAAWRRQIERSNFADAIQQALARLRGPRREVVRLSLDGLTQAEIARTLHKTPKSVESLLSHGRRELGAHLTRLLGPAAPR